MARAVQFDKYGDRNVLYIAEVAVPEPPPGEVLVRVKAAGINPGESKTRSGLRQGVTFPSGQGSDLAGIVISVGDGVVDFAVSDEVLGWTFRGSSHADYASIPSTQLVPKPAEMSWEVAGSLSVVAITGYAAVRAIDAAPNDTVAVSAAAGGVGVVAVQLLRMKQATVLAIAREANRDWLESHGATVVPYGDGLRERLRSVARAGIDAFIDLFGPEYLDLAIDLGVEPERIETIVSFEKAKEVGAKSEGSRDAATADVLVEMTDLAASGLIEIPIANSYPLDRVTDAFGELELGHTRGKIVLIP